MIWECFLFNRDIVSCRFGPEELACSAKRMESEWRELVRDVSKSYHLQLNVCDGNTPKAHRGAQSKDKSCFCWQHPSPGKCWELQTPSVLPQSIYSTWSWQSQHRPNSLGSKHQNLNILIYILQLGVELHTYSPIILKAE